MAWQFYNCLFDMFGLKKIRLPEYDYRSDGWYFVTIVTRDREKIFNNKIKADICDQLIRQAVDVMAGVSIDLMVVMPNHVHVILALTESPLGLGEIVRRIKAKTSFEYQRRSWQPNYYEHVIRGERSLEAVREYIIHNPDKEPTFETTNDI